MLNNRNNVQLRFAKLTMAETGTYNDIMLRPYNVQMDGTMINNITNRVATLGGGKVSGAMLAGIASEAIAPSSEYSYQIAIPNGWGQKRIRFVLEVHCHFGVGSDMIYYFQGYTDFPGVNLATKHIAPEMVFVINSLLGVTRAMVPGPTGMSVRDIVTESSQVLSDPHWQSISQGSMLTMRPQDVFTGMQGAYIQQGFSYMNKNNFQDARNVLRSEPVRSNRLNNMPGSYMAKVIDGYTTAQELSGFGQGDADILSRSIEQVYESPLMENPFLRALSNIRGMSQMSNRFLFSDLMAIDPGVAANINFAVVGQTQMVGVHQAGSSEFWNGTNRETIVATLLSHSVPAIMMDLLLNRTIFQATNHTIDGHVEITMVDAKSLSSIDVRNVNMFQARLEREVLYDISFGNQESYMINMRVDLFGETEIVVSLGSGPMIKYVTPSFCDNLYAPVVTGSAEQFQGVCHDFESLVNNIVQATSTNQAAAVNFSV
jgi:hypothetical protein